jgi:hypothetical protein
MRALVMVAAIAVAAYWIDANWYHSQDYLALSPMLREVVQSIAAAV